jgi:hypothetical protein
VTQTPTPLLCPWGHMSQARGRRGAAPARQPAAGICLMDDRPVGDGTTTLSDPPPRSLLFYGPLASRHSFGDIGVARVRVGDVVRCCRFACRFV